MQINNNTNSCKFVPLLLLLLLLSPLLSLVSGGLSAEPEGSGISSTMGILSLALASAVVSATAFSVCVSGAAAVNGLHRIEIDIQIIGRPFSEKWNTSYILTPLQHLKGYFRRRKERAPGRWVRSCLERSRELRTPGLLLPAVPLAVEIDCLVLIGGLPKIL